MISAAAGGVAKGVMMYHAAETGSN
jgi:hypothetical protein